MPMCDEWELEKVARTLISEELCIMIDPLHYSFPHLLIKSALPDFSRR